MTDADFVKIYAIYRGDTFLFVGTREEVQERYNWSPAAFYRLAKKTRSRKHQLELHYIGKELKPMYQRLRRLLTLEKNRLMRMIMKGDAREKTVANWEGHVQQIDFTFKLLNIMEQEDEQVRAMEEEGKYYE